MNLKGINLILIFNLICLIFSLSLKKNNYSPIEGKVIVIDPGHGGNDNGANNNNVVEDEINLNISKMLYQKLFDKGAITHITRTNDYDLAPEDSINRKMNDLKKRVKFINDVNADLFISIHLNIFDDNKVNGIQVFYQGYKEESKKIAKIIQKTFNKKINKKDKNVKFGDYYLLNYTYPIGILIECGFLSNNEERKKLQNKNYQDEISEIISEGIIEFYR